MVVSLPDVPIQDQDKEEIIESIKVELGYPTVELYITDEAIAILLNKAIRRCASKAIVVSTVERQIINGQVDMKDLNVEVVKNIYTNADRGFVGFSGFPEFDGVGSRMPEYGSRSFISSLSNIGHMAEMRRLLVPDFYFDDGILYVDNYSGTIFIEYLSRDIHFERMDIEWRSWVESYTSALCKITEGRIRGKYRINGAPYEIDGDTLRSEGESQRNELESRLEQALGYWNIIR